MSQEDLAERLDAVERRLDAAYPEPNGAADEAATERLETFAERLADLEAAVEAVEGYVGEIERVDGELEQRADAAIAAAEGAEERIEAVEQRTDGFEERLDTIEVRTEAAPSADDLAVLRSEVATLEDRLAGTETGSAHPSRDSTGGTEFDGPDGPTRTGEPNADATRSEQTSDPNDRRRCDCDVPGTAGDLDGGAPAGPTPGARARDGWKSDARPGDARSEHAVQPPSREAHAPASSSNGADPRSNGTRSQDAGGTSQASASAAAAPSASGPLGDGSRTAPAGRADGGQPERRDAGRASSGPPTISGWDDPDATPTSEPPGGSRPADGGRDDRSWASARTETLLDRLRSLL